MHDTHHESEELSYKQRRKKSREFKTRAEYLEHELSIMNPKRWGINLPFRDYNFEPEDVVPALAGTIGKVVMVAAIVGVWATALQVQGVELSPGFVLENTRYEMIIVGLIFAFLFSGFLNPNANLAGTHGMMVAVIGSVVASGGHPLALGVSVAVMGLALSLSKGGSKLITLTGKGVRGGLLIFLGLTGAIKYVGQLKAWGASAEVGVPHLATVLIGVTIIVYAVLARFKMRWLSIPLCSAIAFGLAYALGAPFAFKTEPGLPNMNPAYWWGESTGWCMGLPTGAEWLAVIPWALLAVAMWPPDFLGHRVFQEMNYPKNTKALMNVDDTMSIASIRQAVGTLLGGGNLASSWGTYMIPAAIAKRPIPAGAVLTGIFCIGAAIIGYPMDLAGWKPVVVVALLVGVFLPLLEAGMQMIRDEKSAQAAGVCIFASALVNPVFGWSLTMLLDNMGLIGDKHRGKELKFADSVVIPGAAFAVCTFIMAAVGILPGIPAFLDKLM
ncbi:DUF3360 family protein [Sulfuriroseicoccus oceanibius]|uniref:DUF3360 family protein n=1 Tax=Sulfuriroseicoccus oceanibius TaxID=2707525 RepID=A0A6B3L849_9BACT|nr:DUF3360 family protein [Sulfuriroseicoccus oceanibius]QQL44098.1 DUF3360 family protein [Sulfuriroseicoccus oceanibius]